MSFELIFLGTGTSAGVPMIGCECPVCTSGDPRDRRDRPSVLIRYHGGDDGPLRQVLIDTSPDMRQQMIRHRVNRLDAVLYTHAHADHVFGLDDLRRFNAVMKSPLDIYAEVRVLDVLKEMFPYVFSPENNVNDSFIPMLIPHALDPDHKLKLFGAVWTPIRMMHGRLPILGFRVDFAGKSLAYCTDVSSFPPQSYPLLQDLDVLVIDGLRFRHHPTHLNIEQALEQIERIEPGQAFLTHMAHDIMHADVDPTLPEGVNLSYDGLVIDLMDKEGKSRD